MRTLKEQLSGRCKHFTGFPHGRDADAATCKAGVNYYELVRYYELGELGCACRIPCSGREPGSQYRAETVQKCDSYCALTPQEIQAEIDEFRRLESCIQRGVSYCCEAPIDESRVILDGPHQGHGPRFCSKCGKTVFMV